MAPFNFPPNFPSWEPHDPSLSANTPLAPAPPGFKTDFTSPEWNGWRVIVIVVVMLFFTTVVLGVRLHARFFVTRQYGFEEWFVLIGWAINVFATATMIKMTQYGLGSYEWNISMLEWSYRAFWAWTGNVYFLANMFVKFAILRMYLRTFDPKVARRTWFHVTVYALFFIAFVGGMWGFWAAMTPCHHVEYLWMPSKTKLLQSCWVYKTPLGPSTVGISAAAINIFVDVVMVALPVPILWNLHLPLKQRLVATALFSLTLTATILSAMRLRAMVLSHTWGPNQPHNWQYQEIIFYGPLEVDVLIICGCLPLCRIPWVRTFDWFRSLYDRTSGSLSRSRSRSRSHGSSAKKLYNYDSSATTSSTRPSIFRRWFGQSHKDSGGEDASTVSASDVSTATGNKSSSPPDVPPVPNWEDSFIEKYGATASTVR